MKTIIAGSRGIENYTRVQTILNTLKQKFLIDEVVSGTARGVDLLGERWAKEHNIKISRYPADWKTHGKPAGHIRNHQMALYADILVALWDGESRGTQNMISNMSQLNKPFVVFTITENIVDLTDHNEVFRNLLKSNANSV